MPHRILVALIVLCSGCYFYYPDVKRAKPPQAPPGEQIQVDADVRTGWTTCGEYVEGCVVRGGVLKRPYKYTEASFRYNGKVLTKGELRALVSPETHDKKYKSVAELKGTCNLSLIPSVIYVIGAIATTIAAAGDDQLGDSGKYVAIGGVATMLGGAAISYPVGGYACMKAKRRAEEHGITDDSVKRFTVSHRSDAAMTRLQEIGQLVDDFNERARLANRRAPVEDAPADDAPEAPASGLPNLRDVVAADARFATFLRVCEAVEITELTGANDYTVLAPTEEAFAKLPPGTLDSWLSASGRERRRVQKLLLRHFVRDTRTAEQLAAETRLRPARGSKLDVVVENGTVIVDGGTVSSGGLPASNGIVFGIDRVFE